MDDHRRAQLIALLAERADRAAGGALTEADPFEFVLRGEALSARLYPRYNRTVVLAIDAYVDDVVESLPVLHFIATRSGVMPFATLHLDRPMPGTDGPTVVNCSHVLVADSVTGAVLDEVLDGLTFMARRARRRIAELVASAVDAPPATSPYAATPAADGPPPHEQPSPPSDSSVHGAATRSTPASTPPRAELDEPRDPVDASDPIEPFDLVGGAEALARSEVAAGFTHHPCRRRPQHEVLAELSTLVGLDAVTREVSSLIDAQVVAERRRDAGLAAYAPSPHLVFVGNPGTGKTSVARLVGELYAAIGLLPSGHVIETDRAGLVAGYVGQTALKTRAVCEHALGGVLFIDEAYSLAGSDHDYGPEALETLLTFMENHRGEFAVVVAGYPDEMATMLAANPGLRSRFDLTIPFADFTATQLEQIFGLLAQQHDYDVPPATMQRVRAVIAAWPRHHGFGNAREVRKLFSDITRRHATLVAADTSGTCSLGTLPPEAVPAPVAATTAGHRGYL